MYSEYVDKSTNLEEFEKWKPKIEKYLSNLEANTVKEWKAPESLVPDNLDSIFNATLIPDKVMNAKDLEITTTPAVKLAAKIASGELTSVETFEAFAKRATIAHQFTNCAMEFFIDEGLKRAEELDSYFKETGKTVGPLHGLPISLKEHYGYKGRVTHASYVSMLDNVTKEHAITLQTFYDAGAVFYIRTTEPQSLMHLDSVNNITGRGRNPYNLQLGPGGSSSGEGIIVAMKGCSMGIGTDIGGSIRAPSGFCGIWGLRPTQKRISMKGCVAAIGGQEGVVCCMGPMVRYAEDIDFWMRSALSQKPWLYDCDLVPLPWREVERPIPSKLKIAIMYDDGLVRPHPPIERGLDHLADVLKKAGVEVVTFKPHRMLEVMETVNTLYSSDSNAGQLAALSKSGEPLVPLTKWAFGFGKGTGPLNTQEYRQCIIARDSIRADYLKIMNDEGIDYILGPVATGVAPMPSTLRYWGYTALWNLIDMPNVIFPTGLFQDPKVDLVKPHKTRNDIESYEYGLYDDPVKFTGAPINLQLTGRRYRDEELVKCGELFAELLSDN